jgi:WD40 repeat protein
MLIVWSQDGSRLVLASSDKTVRIWDIATGQCASTLSGHFHWASSITWSPDGSRLASGSFDKTVRIWDPATGHCEITLDGHSDAVYSIAWSSDESRFASASKDNTVRVWNLAAGQCASALEGHSGPVMSITWSQDGSRLASASDDNTVRIWNPDTGQCESAFSISSPYFLQFDRSKMGHLHTSIGTFNIESVGSLTSTSRLCPSLPEQYGYGLTDDRSWITYNGVNLLWLPAEYRPTKSSLFAVSATTLAIGCSSGLVIFLALTEQSPISCL